MSEKRQYPRDVWVLQPSMKPKKVTVVKRYASYSSTDYGDQTEEGTRYGVTDMHASEAEAIREGWKRIAAIQADINKRQENLDKKRAVLAGAEAKKELK